MDKITFIGTAGGRFSVGSQLRASAGIIFSINGIQFHLDPGPGSLNKAKEFGINLRSNNVLLVSHCHLDHCNDINAVIDAMTYGGLEKRGILVGSKSVLEGVKGEYPYVTKMHRNFLINSTVITPGENISFGNNVGIVATKTKHRDETCVGFKIYSEKFSVGYTADTCYFDTLYEDFKDVDILIINNVLPFGVNSEDHMNSEDSAKLIDEVKPKLAIITHFGKKILNEDPIYQAREIQKRCGIQVVAARDGMVINPFTYSATLRDKSLNI